MPAHNHGREGGSDRIRTKRRLYRNSNKRGRSNDPNVVEEPTSDEEDDESLERKIARLRREVAEVKGEFDRRKTEDNNGLPAATNEGEDSLDALNDVLNSANAVTSKTVQTQMVKRLGIASRAPSTPQNIPKMESLQQSQENSTYTVTYAPSFQQNHTLSKVAEFDARLTLIETALGIDTLPLPAQERLATKAVFPILDNLDRQLFTVSSSGDSLDSIDRKVRQLTQDAQKLNEARASAKAAQEALYENSAQPKQPQGGNDAIKKLSEIEDSEQTSKINALYGTLTTIDSLAPLLPSVLDRLRSLQPIHADATSASENLAKLEARQEAMAEDFQSWRDGLEKVEAALRQGAQQLSGNVGEIETLVHGLEGRMQNLSPG